ncbi:KATNB1-like protein 1 [Chanos chanos]|uniref:KATNB1-like protein 1 n=1 Tax=Chanos chanos TaxID=29144 RepID=A0A6J2V8M9_CHACN|nr:KATNB1-like protein 1 [Chanos chanos]
MASGSHGGNETEFHRLKQAHPCNPLKHRIHTGAEGNMREVEYLNKEEIDKERFPVGRCAHNFGKAKRASACKRKTRGVAVSSGQRRRAPPAGGARDMANKENELACAEPAHGIPGFPVNSAEASKMAGAGSKYSDYFSELSKDHDAMTHVLFGRNLRLNVALTLWRKNASELVAYLIRIQDTGVLVDCLPVLSKSLQDEETSVSIGCCVDLLPQVKAILASKYDVHLTVALHWVQSVIKKWWPELSANGKNLQTDSSRDKNVEIMRKQLQEMWEEGSRLSSVPGTVGELAKVIESFLSQLR